MVKWRAQLEKRKITKWETKLKLSYDTSYNLGGGLRKSHNATHGQRIEGFNVTEVRSYDI